MSNIDDFYSAVKLLDFSKAYQILNGMSLTGMLTALDTLIPPDLDAFWGSRGASASEANLPQIEFAKQVVEERVVPSHAPGASAQTGPTTEAANYLIEWKKPHFIASDPTGASPRVNIGAPKLSQSDYEKAADDYQLEAALIHAVAFVESGGMSGFDDKGRPKILFEAHIFHKKTQGRYQRRYPYLSQPTWELGKAYYKWDQWTRMYEAMRLDLEAAWSSASWGMFQIMGFNHSGWDNVSDFVQAMFISEAMHLKSFLDFCRSAGLIEVLRKKEWASFARAYNGDKYAENKYDQKLQNAYTKYSQGVVT